MLKRENPPQKLSTIPPGPGALRIAKPVKQVQSLQPEPRRPAGDLYSPKMSAEMADWIKSMKGR